MSQSGRRVEAVAIAAIGLDAIHRIVGLVEEGGGFVAILRKQADADAGCDHDLRATSDNRAVQGFTDRNGNTHRVVGIANFVEQHDKLVTADACQKIRLADDMGHAAACFDQHLITASFRCIETRVPMVRAVNTGISAFIDGDGVVREPSLFLDLDALMRRPAGSGKTDPTTAAAAGIDARTSMRDPKTGRYYKGLNAVLVSEVPLDNRTSLYVRWGDWFAAVCLAFSIGMLGMGIMGRRADKPVPAAA